MEDSRDRGKLEIIPAKRLKRLDHIQRVPPKSSVRTLARDYDEEKEGILHVARISDGEYKGVLHPYEGGTRTEAMMSIDPNHLFTCWVKDMTEQEAAQAFRSERDSKKPSAFSNWKVGCRAGEWRFLSVKQAIDAIGLIGDEGRSTYGNGKPGLFSAFAAADRIVKWGYAKLVLPDGLSDEDRWQAAGDHLEWTLRMTRRAYPQHGSSNNDNTDAHQADIIQAVSAVGLRNPRVVGDEHLETELVSAVNTYYPGDRKFDTLFENRQTMRPNHWLTAFVAVKKNMGGSSSRGLQIQKLIVKNLHRGFDTRLKIEA